jgi:YaiO family outer membrane protein
MTMAFTADSTRRFGLTDNYGEARVDYVFAPGRSFHVLAGGTPGADYRPTWQVGIGASLRVHGGPYATALLLDMRRAEYPSGDVQTLSLGAEQHLAGRAWLSGNWINVLDNGTHSSGWLARGDVMATERIRLFAGAADAPDLDAGVVIRTKSLFGGLEMDVGDHLTLRTSVSHDDPEGPSDRNTLALGMGYRF